MKYFITNLFPNFNQKCLLLFISYNFLTKFESYNRRGEFYNIIYNVLYYIQYTI